MHKIKVENISKRFTLRKETQYILHFIKSLLKKEVKTNKQELQALSEVSFDVSPGEVVGIIGKNGSGKSTLLKIIAGLFVQDSGTVLTDSTPLYVSGFGHSTNQYLTVKQNIFLIGSIMGLPAKLIRDNIEEIISFAGLEEFTDVEVIKLSSGMVSRLNMSAMFHVMEYLKSDILLLDEVLSVGGDLEFKNKGIIKIESLINSGAAIVLVTHDLEFAKKYCHRLVWLEKGRVKMQGKPDEVVELYSK